MSVLLKKPQFEGISQKELVQQLESKKKAKTKLPTWFNSNGIYYPPRIHIEQTSSEITAAYKSNLVSGKSLVDLTGGFGVDSYFFSKKIASVFHCETNKELSAIASYNFNQLNTDNIECYSRDGFLFLEESSKTFDWIFVDPSRRNDSKGKVFLLKDCEPNIPNTLSELFKYSKNVLIKVSPLLDISQAIQELQYVKQVHVVAVESEVKEVLFILEFDFIGDIEFHAVNLISGRKDVFTFTHAEEKKLSPNLGLPSTYLYEPNPAVLKSGAFKSIGNHFGLKKLHTHSHLYTLDKLIEFPGRRFLIKTCLPYSKKTIKSFKGIKANVTTRNFPTTVAELRKKHQILDGGESYFFFTKLMDESKQVIVCEKVADGK
ncbi:THUMP-like domain-containing protein [Flagellimonas sp.]|uniref:THUMP-like domain-containing protein n=1 Tax=Flagellimonas sp. TaxID=2058762 RepID=UPI003F4A16F2